MPTPSSSGTNSPLTTMMSMHMYLWSIPCPGRAVNDGSRRRKCQWSLMYAPEPLLCFCGNAVTRSPGIPPKPEENRSRNTSDSGLELFLKRFRTVYNSAMIRYRFQFLQMRNASMNVIVILHSNNSPKSLASTSSIKRKSFITYLLLLGSILKKFSRKFSNSTALTNLATRKHTSASSAIVCKYHIDIVKCLSCDSWSLEKAIGSRSNGLLWWYSVPPYQI